MEKYKHEKKTIFKEWRRKTHKNKGTLEILVTYSTVYTIIPYQKDKTLKTKNAKNKSNIHR